MIAGCHATIINDGMMPLAVMNEAEKAWDAVV